MPLLLYLELFRISSAPLPAAYVRIFCPADSSVAGRPHCRELTSGRSLPLAQMDLLSRLYSVCEALACAAPVANSLRSTGHPLFSFVSAIPLTSLKRTPSYLDSARHDSTQ